MVLQEAERASLGALLGKVAIRFEDGGQLVLHIIVSVSVDASFLGDNT